MEAYLRERFPFVDADDTVQETLIALIRSMPIYRYVPEETGRFHSYLTGILRHKALRQVRSDRQRAKIAEMLRQDAPHGGRTRSPIAPQAAIKDNDQSWRESIMEIALQQLLADESIHERTREVFRRVAVNGEKPEDVALSFGISRNAVDQMKSRMTLRMKELVRALEKADGGDSKK